MQRCCEGALAAFRERKPVETGTSTAAFQMLCEHRGKEGLQRWEALVEPQLSAQPRQSQRCCCSAPAAQL